MGTGIEQFVYQISSTKKMDTFPCNGQSLHGCAIEIIIEAKWRRIIDKYLLDKQLFSKISVPRVKTLLVFSVIEGWISIRLGK